MGLSVDVCVRLVARDHHHDDDGWKKHDKRDHYYWSSSIIDESSVGGGGGGGGRQAAFSAVAAEAAAATVSGSSGHGHRVHADVDFGFFGLGQRGWKVFELVQVGILVSPPLPSLPFAFLLVSSGFLGFCVRLSIVCDEEFGSGKVFPFSFGRVIGIVSDSRWVSLARGETLSPNVLLSDGMLRDLQRFFSFCAKKKRGSSFRPWLLARKSIRQGRLLLSLFSSDATTIKETGLLE